MAWTQHELDIFETASRTSSILSLLGASFIIVTFCTSKNFHRPINRLAFYASFGNILTNVATIYSLGGIRAGENSMLCQAQGAIIQWAIFADALFCLAMAWNVYLTVFWKKTTKQLRVLEPYYIAACYGVPLVSSITFLFIKTEERGRIYGPAALWCWISDEWQILRIATFYGPAWVVIVTTFSIYVFAGRVIFNFRRNLRDFARDLPLNPLLPNHRQNQLMNIAPGKIAVTTVDTIEMIKTEGLETPNNPNADALSQTMGHRSAIEAELLRPIATPRAGNSAIEANTAAWAYCRCAMLFFLALGITWLPSSINRVYTLVNPGSTNFTLNLSAALVLPAQGFWNGLIYIVTTLPACKKLCRDIWSHLQHVTGRIQDKWRWLRKPGSTESLSSA